MGLSEILREILNEKRNVLGMMPHPDPFEREAAGLGGWMEDFCLAA